MKPQNHNPQLFLYFTSLLITVIQANNFKLYYHQICIIQNPCYKDGTISCTPISSDTRTCKCRQGWVGKDCSIRLTENCNLAEQNLPAYSKCLGDTFECHKGFETIIDSTSNSTACKDIDECLDKNNNCNQPNTICQNRLGSFNCKCKGGYQYDINTNTCQDIDECERSGKLLCFHTRGSTCVNLPGEFSCQCPLGYEKVPIEEPGNNSPLKNEICTEINECQVTPNICGKYGTCINKVGSYTCRCKRGYEFWEGTCKRRNPCRKTNICGFGEVCKKLSITTYQCVCARGYKYNRRTRECEDINECEKLAFQYKHDDSRDCVNLNGTFSFKCASGYRGDGEKNCFDIDECKENADICPSDRICVNTIGSYSCECKKAGYSFNNLSGKCQVDCSIFGEGEVCGIEDCSDCKSKGSGFNSVCGRCVDIDECKPVDVDTPSSVCNTENSVCLNTFGSFECQCNEGYERSSVSSDSHMCQDINECEVSIQKNSTICHMNSSCSNKIGSYDSGMIICNNFVHTTTHLHGMFAHKKKIRKHTSKIVRNRKFYCTWYMHIEHVPGACKDTHMIITAMNAFAIKDFYKIKRINNYVLTLTNVRETMVVTNSV